VWGIEFDIYGRVGRKEKGFYGGAWRKEI